METSPGFKKIKLSPYQDTVHLFTDVGLNAEDLEDLREHVNLAINSGERVLFVKRGVYYKYFTKIGKKTLIYSKDVDFSDDEFNEFCEHFENYAKNKPLETITVVTNFNVEFIQKPYVSRNPEGFKIKVLDTRVEGVLGKIKEFKKLQSGLF